MQKKDYAESLDHLAGEQQRREAKLLSELLGESSFDDLSAYEANLSGQESRLLFSIQAEIEDTEMALRQSEVLAQKLKKHLSRLKGLQKVLSK
ncbi:MAG: hypothetical protein JW846_01030 [Dehalococcoidia bacterium]|nr:hypothetical protein [Dehalococcoidia bacterium]